MTPKKSRGYDTATPLLDVYMGNDMVGQLGRHGGDVWFKYTEAAMAAPDPGRHQLSVRLPVRVELYDHEATLASSTTCCSSRIPRPP